RRIPVHSSQTRAPGALPLAHTGPGAPGGGVALSQRSRAGGTARPQLCGELLGFDAMHIWDWRGQPGVDGGADRGHGHREDLSWRAASEPGDRDHLAGTFGPLAGPSCLALGWNWGLST